MGTLGSGIYAIINTTNNKRYIGKSINISQRWRNHKVSMKKGSKDSNRHLNASVNKYGIESFRIEVLESIPIDATEDFYKERELYWMDYYQTCDRQFGYNLRRDSSTRMHVHPETREIMSKNSLGEGNPNYGNRWSEEAKQRMSELKKRQYATGEAKVNPDAPRLAVESRNRRWEEDPGLKELMARRVSSAVSKYNILCICRDTGDILESFDSMMTLRDKYPDVGKTVINSVCNGWKKSYRGKIWRYQDKKTLEIIEPEIK